MRKSRSRNLYLIGVLLVIAGLFLRLIDLSNHVNPSTGVVTGSTPAVILIAGLLLLLGGILMTVAWIGALMRTAQLQRWGWFVCLLVLSGITMLAYIFAGPEIPPAGKQLA
jgi:hypothetical protein